MFSFQVLYFKMHAYLKGRIYSCLKVDFTMRQNRDTPSQNIYICNDLESSRCSKIAFLQTY